MNRSLAKDTRRFKTTVDNTAAKDLVDSFSNTQATALTAIMKVLDQQQQTIDALIQQQKADNKATLDAIKAMCASIEKAVGREINVKSGDNIMQGGERPSRLEFDYNNGKIVGVTPVYED